MKEKYLNSVILVVIATGTALVAMVGDASRGAEPLQSVFLAFLAAILAIQVVPAVMLVGCLIKGLFTRSVKESE